MKLSSVVATIVTLAVTANAVPMLPYKPVNTYWCYLTNCGAHAIPHQHHASAQDAANHQYNQQLDATAAQQANNPPPQQQGQGGQGQGGQGQGGQGA
jgi:hypothetical protein